MLRSNLSARSMPEDGQEHVHSHMLLPSRPSFGCKAKNLLDWCQAPTKVNTPETVHWADICHYSMSVALEKDRFYSIIYWLVLTSFSRPISRFSKVQRIIHEKLKVEY